MSGMYGWRAVIGVVNPRRNDIPYTPMEMEMAAPEGVVFRHAFLDGPHSLDPEHLRSLLPDVAREARALAEGKPPLDLVLAAGAPISLANGPDRVIAALKDATGLPATTNLTGVINALHRLDIARLIVVCPYYSDGMAGLLRDFLAGAGFDIVSVVRGDVAFGKHDEASPRDTFRLAKGAFLAGPPADGLFLAGGGAPSYEILEALELDIGAPVVANNFASLWNCLDMLHVRQPVQGFGRLLTCF